MICVPAGESGEETAFLRGAIRCERTGACWGCAVIDCMAVSDISPSLIETFQGGWSIETKDDATCRRMTVLDLRHHHVWERSPAACEHCKKSRLQSFLRLF